MKNLLIVLLVTIPFLKTFSQSLFEKYEDTDEVIAISVSGYMFKMLSKIHAGSSNFEEQKVMDIAKDLTSLKVFITKNKQKSSEMKNSVNSYLKNRALKELMKIKDNGDNINFYIKEGDKEGYVEEFLMFVTSSKDRENKLLKGITGETVLLSLKGNVELDKISALTEYYNLPKALNNIDKRKKKRKKKRKNF